jgi:Leucine-rich repeat (LRR) protein
MLIFTAKAQVSQSEFDALVALYNSTNGNNWTDKSNWNVTTATKDDVTSDWYGLYVSSGHVRSLHLNNNNLSGTIPSSIGDLTNLGSIYLYENQLTGTIPSSIENITYLRQLKLNDNQLTGNIPSEIGNLLSLEKIFLENNQLSGSIPNGIGNLTKLTFLSLDNNQFSGSIPSEIGNLSKIYSIDLKDNNFSGPIPEEIGMLTTLKYLFLQNNQLTGDFPTQIQSVTDLTQLHIHNNRITSLPDLTGLPLTWLKISDNNLTFGDIETNFSKLSCAQCLYSPQAKTGEEQHLYAAIGSNITISVNVDGNHNTYQWYKGTSTLIPGAVNASYTISNFQLDDERTYYCKIQNTVATALTLQSNDIVISSSAIPAITTQPVTLNNFCVDATASFSIEDNYAETYQWQEKSPSGNWQDITDATNWTGYDTQSISSVQANIQYLNGYSYRCAISNPNNSATSDATVLNTDLENPDLTVQDFTLELDATGNAILEASDVIISVSDNCTIDATILSKTAFDCSNIGTPVTVDVTVTDISGNSITKQASITTVDNVDPVLTLQNYTLELDAAGNAILKASDIVTSATDNCTIADTTLSKTNFDCSNIGTPVNIDVILSDESGNETTEQVTITVVDNINPTLNVQNYTLELDATGNATLKASDLVTSATDNCTIADTTLSKTAFDCSNIGTPVTIDVTLSDASGNDVTKQTTITVVDNIDPILSVQNHTLQLDADGNAILKPTDVVLSTSDNCSLADTILSQTAFNCSNIGTPVTVNVTLSDESGNETTEQVTITVEDNVDPQFDVNDHTLELNENGEATLVGADVSSNTADNCSISSIALSKNKFDCSNIGIPEVIDVTLSDVNGNETTKQSTITVIDNDNPTLNVQNITLELDATGNAILKTSDVVISASDNCELADTTLSKSDFNCANIGTPINVDVTLSDESGNDVTKQATITVVDNVDPVLIVQNHTLQLDADGNATLKLSNVVMSTSDNCELADTTLSQTDFDCSNVGTPVTVDVTLSDESGNDVTKQVTITVEDNVDPEIISTHNNKTITDEGNCEATLPDYTGTVIATDNCDNDLNVTQFPAPGTLITGQIPIKLTATDDSDNEAEVTFDLFVDDITNPELIVKNFTLQLDDQGKAILLPADVVTKASDNCTLADTTLSKSNFDCTNIGTPVTVFVTLSDQSGNEITEQVIITIEDNIDPEIPVLDDIIKECSASVPAPTTNDNCADVITATTSDPLTYDTQGEYTITWNFNDGNGNSIDAIQKVIIDDITNPTITCHNDTSLTLNQEQSVYHVKGTELDPILTNDNCSIASVVNDMNNKESLKDEEFNSGTATITWTITDEAGNKNSCIINVTVNIASEINDNLIESGTTIYPNPASTYFKILNSNNLEKTVTIFDCTGKLIKTDLVIDKEKTIDISTLPEGIYFISIKSKKQIKTYKLVKE